MAPDLLKYPMHGSVQGNSAMPGSSDCAERTARTARPFPGDRSPTGPVPPLDMAIEVIGIEADGP